MAPKKKVERTAASSRPKRTPKPTTVATSSAPAPKPKKKTTASKKAAATKVTKKTAPKKAATKKSAPKKAGAIAKKGAQKASTAKYEKWVIPPYENPHGPVEGQKRIDARKKKEAEASEKYKHENIGSRYTPSVIKELKKDYEEGVSKGEWEKMGFDNFLKTYKGFDAQAWDKAHERKIGNIEGDYTSKQADAMIKDMHARREKGEIPHILTITDYLYWKEIDKERAKIIAKYKADYKKEQKKKQGNASAVSSPVKKVQNSIVNASPVKKAQDALTRSRSKSPEKQKKIRSHDSGHQADNEQQSVMSRTWELAANAVEAMRSAVNPE
ncbi:hypothetical protein KCU81_g4879, partial [Aureobasidium melanogenum]|uniref:Uncharacterized protein n=1 Tax=Aureobasidium melanogenum (strain CBS 110374) TaxID=1043003 RepID=A0A074VF45_AURM1